jgi:tRNA threonylcarbamoyladenosine biosynthesis protein TsaB
MKTILALEASSDIASVALWRDGVLLAGKEFPSKRSLSAELFPVLAELLEGKSAVDEIVVGLGPGSYAGVRITIAAAIGLQCVWGCPVSGIPSVAALSASSAVYQAIGDARRGTWYYSQVVDGECQEGPLLLNSATELRERISRGKGAVCASELLGAEWGSELCVPRAALLAQLAESGRGVVQRSNLEPLYLRDPHITLPKAP